MSLNKSSSKAKLTPKKASTSIFAKLKNVIDSLFSSDAKGLAKATENVFDHIKLNSEEAEAAIILASAVALQEPWQKKLQAFLGARYNETHDQLKPFFFDPKEIFDSVKGEEETEYDELNGTPTTEEESEFEDVKILLLSYAELLKDKLIGSYLLQNLQPLCNHLSSHLCLYAIQIGEAVLLWFFSSMVHVFDVDALETSLLLEIPVKPFNAKKKQTFKNLVNLILEYNNKKSYSSENCSSLEFIGDALKCFGRDLTVESVLKQSQQIANSQIPKLILERSSCTRKFVHPITTKTTTFKDHTMLNSALKLWFSEIPDFGKEYPVEYCILRAYDLYFWSYKALMHECSKEASPIIPAVPLTSSFVATSTTIGQEEEEDEQDESPFTSPFPVTGTRTYYFQDPFENVREL